jgi:hypothetical protein
MGSGLVIGFNWLLNNSWAHFTDHCHTQISVLSHVGWLRLPTADVPLLPFPTAPVLAFLQPSQSVGRSVKLLLAVASTVIPGFSLLEIRDQDFYTDHTENTTSNSSSIVKWRHYWRGPHTKHRFQQLFQCCVLHSRYLTMTVYLAPLFY